MLLIYPEPLSTIKNYEIDETFRYLYAPLLITALEKEVGKEKVWNQLITILNSEKSAKMDYDFFKKSLIKSGITENEFKRFEDKYILSENAKENIIKVIKQKKLRQAKVSLYSKKEYQNISTNLIFRKTATKEVKHLKLYRMLTFNKHYFGFFILIFLVEVLIALFVNDNFVRPYLGDVLVVILIYCFIKSFLKLPVLPVAMFVLIFSFTVEFLQFLNIIEKLHLEESKIARTVIGTSFSWIDLLTYIIGIAIVILIEKYWLKKEIRTLIQVS